MKAGRKPKKQALKETSSAYSSVVDVTGEVRSVDLAGNFELL